MRKYLTANVPVGPYLADQWLLPLGISAWQSGDDKNPRGGSFRTVALSEHSLTHIAVLKSFLDIEIAVQTEPIRGNCEVIVGLPRGHGRPSIPAKYEETEV